MKKYRIHIGIEEIRIDVDGTMYGKQVRLVEDKFNLYGYSAKINWIEIKEIKE